MTDVKKAAKKAADPDRDDTLLPAAAAFAEEDAPVDPGPPSVSPSPPASPPSTLPEPESSKHGGDH